MATLKHHPLHFTIMSLSPFLEFIDLDKSGYQVNIFLISPQKHMLWVLIRSKVLLMSTQNICFPREIRKKNQHLRNEKASYQDLCGILKIYMRLTDEAYWLKPARLSLKKLSNFVLKICTVPRKHFMISYKCQYKTLAA